MAVEIEMVIELKEEPMMTGNTDAQIRHVYEQCTKPSRCAISMA